MASPARSQLSLKDLIEKRQYPTPVDNIWFVSTVDAKDKHQSISLSVEIDEAKMYSSHAEVQVNGKFIDVFPACTIDLINYQDNLVPLDRNLIRTPQGNSYWDITLSPGKIWSEADDVTSDQGAIQSWFRAALPFQLSNIFENDSHHGVMTFLYCEDQISPIYYQITTETKAFVAPDNLIAWGYLDASPTPLTAPLKSEKSKNALINIQHEINDQLPIENLNKLRSTDNQSYFEDIETGFGAHSTIVSGLVMDDKIYSTRCQTQYGDYPYPRAMKFGIWSATKTAFCTIACLRLAQIYDEDPRSALVNELLPEAKNIATWEKITIGDCLNMATGIGTAGTNAEPLNIFADYILDIQHAIPVSRGLESYGHYFSWFLAPSQHQKNKAAFACPGYIWGPGKITRYRDQDLYIAGAALDAWLKIRQGPDARIWDLVEKQVYQVAGIHHAVKFHTLETNPKDEVPLSDAGLLLTMDNIANLGKLILDHGKVDGKQILHAEILDELFNPRSQKGLATGTQTKDGEIFYHGGIWHLPYRSQNNELFWIPTMRGYGGQLIQTLPNGTTVFRFGFDSYETEERYDMLKMVRLSDSISPF